jgi:hypothetical protein
MKDPDLSKQLIIEKILEFGISANPMAGKQPAKPKPPTDDE